MPSLFSSFRFRPPPRHTQYLRQGYKEKEPEKKACRTLLSSARYQWCTPALTETKCQFPLSISNNSSRYPKRFPKSKVRQKNNLGRCTEETKTPAVQR